ncbi:MAG: glycine betaine/L-proline ABC transporter substrate-binding protein ProX [Rhodospirillaceae bacterium]
MAAAVWIGASSTPAQAQVMPGEGVDVRMVMSVTPEENFQSMVIAQALEDLGYSVSLTEPMAYYDAHVAIAEGQADLLTFHWDPLHSGFYADLGGADKMTRLGSLVPEAYQGYLIDKKSAIVNGIRDLDQLKDPEFAQIYDIDGDGKADLFGCDQGWACAEVINHQIEAYGLSDTVTHHQGIYSEQVNTVIDRFHAGDPVLFYSWTPYWIAGEMKPGVYSRWLNVPFSSLPGARAGEDTSLGDGRNPGFAVNTLRILARPAFLEANPAAAIVLEAATIDPEDISAQNLLMKRGESSPSEVRAHAKEWTDRHLSSYFDWLDAARAVVPEGS